MKKTFYILICFFALTLISCGDMSKNIQETVDNAAKDAQVEMTADITNSKVAFEDTYKKALQGSTDSSLTKN